MSTASSIRRECDVESEKLREMESAMGSTTAQWCDAFANFSDFVKTFRDHESDKLIQINKLTKQSKALCEELDQTQMVMDNTHHDCMSII